MLRGAEAVAHTPLRVWAVACVVAVSAFVSATATVLAALLCAIVWWTVRRSSGFEHRALCTLFITAIVIRIVLIAALTAHADVESRTRIISFPFDGDGAFMKLRAMWQRYVWMNIELNPHNEVSIYSRYGQTSYVTFIALVQYLLGPAPYAIHLINVCCHMATTAVLHRIVRTAYGAVAGLVLAAAMLFMPSLILWSSSALKDSSYLLLFATAIAAALSAARSRSVWTGAASVLLFAAAVWSAETVRRGALAIGIAGVALAIALHMSLRRAWLAAAMVITAAVFVVSGAAMDLAPRALPAVVSAANIHLGNVNTVGHHYQLLDSRFYAGESLDGMTVGEAARFVRRALASFVTVPLPNDIRSPVEFLLLPQQLIWYAVFALAIAGLPTAWRQDSAVTALLVGMIVPATVVIALYNGNVGTLVRIRDSVVPFVLCLAAVTISRALMSMSPSLHAGREPRAIAAGTPARTWTQQLAALDEDRIRIASTVVASRRADV